MNSPWMFCVNALLHECANSSSLAKRCRSVQRLGDLVIVGGTGRSRIAKPTRKDFLGLDICACHPKKVEAHVVILIV